MTKYECFMKICERAEKCGYRGDKQSLIMDLKART